MRGAVVCAALVVTSGCVTRKVWNWAGEGDYAFLPSRVTALGLGREEGRPDRLFLRVDGESPAPAPASEDGAPEDRPREEGEYYVLEVPPDWKERPRVAVPDGIQPEDLQLGELLETRLTPKLSEETIGSLAPVPLDVAGSFPAVDSVAYAFVQGPPGVLFIYGADAERGTWVRLSSVITGRVISTPAPKFNYALAVIATPVTAAVDVVGVVVYAILWPLWTSMDIGYEDADAGGYRPEESYEGGRARRELEQPQATGEETEAPPARVESDA